MPRLPALSLRRFVPPAASARRAVCRPPIAHRSSATLPALSMADAEPAPTPCADDGGAKPVEPATADGATASNADAGPELSARDFRLFNQYAERMNFFHEHFRSTWRTLYGACEAARRPAGMTLRQFCDLGIDFCRTLALHHGIEEQRIFPYLARRMPAFRRELLLLTQHKAIHAGMDEMEAYLEECRAGQRDFRFPELRAKMDGFGEVLWAHLDEEVRELGAKNMAKYWSKEDLRRIPF